MRVDAYAFRRSTDGSTLHNLRHARSERSGGPAAAEVGGSGGGR